MLSYLSDIRCSCVNCWEAPHPLVVPFAPVIPTPPCVPAPSPRPSAGPWLYALLPLSSGAPVADGAVATPEPVGGGRGEAALPRQLGCGGAGVTALSSPSAVVGEAEGSCSVGRVAGGR